jgi:hypothetical protein
VTTARKTISVLFVLLVLLFGYITLTVPMIAATAPALITIVLAVAAFIVWPRHRKGTPVA